MINNTLHPILWLWIPALAITIQTAIEIFLPRDLLGTLHNENGPIESLQFLVAALSFVVALLCMRHAVQKKNPWLTGWSACFALGCLYIAGEEVSWGQHILDWSTPEFWSAVNDQNETNLHNTSSWLDQKPRLILFIGVVVGGLLIPLARSFAPAVIPKQFEIIYPPSALWLTALIATCVKLIDKVSEATHGVPILARGSEVEELFLFYFVFVYLIALHRRTICA